MAVESFVSAGDDGSSISIVLAVAAVVSFVFSPLFGALSDRTRSRFGRRRVYMLLGVAGSAVTIWPALAAGSLFTYTLFFCVAQMFNTMAAAPWNGLVADRVPPSQFATSSGVVGTMSIVGSLLGAALSFLQPRIGTPAVVAAVYAIYAASTAVTALGVPERRSPGRGPFPLFAVDLRPAPAPRPPARGLPATAGGSAVTARDDSGDGDSDPGFDAGESPPSLLEGLIAPFRSPDFCWVFVTRFLVQMGVYTVQNFMQPYLENAIVRDDGMSAETALGLVAVPLLLAALLSPIAAGHLSRRLGDRRKVFVFAAGALMVAADALLALRPPFWYLPPIGALFGLGYGAFTAVDFAMVLDILPEPEAAAKDLGVWNMALVVPMTFAAPVAGVLLDTVNRASHNLGYSVIFGLSAVYLLLGVVFVTRIKGVK